MAQCLTNSATENSSVITILQQDLWMIGLVHLLHYVTHREFFKVNHPGPMPWPIIGNANQFVGTSNDGFLGILFNVTERWRTCRFWLGSKYGIVITQPEDAEAVLNHCLDRDEVHDFMSPLYGEGIITLRNPRWKEHRRFLDPCFAIRMLQSFDSILNKEMGTMMEKVKQEAKTGNTFDLYSYMSLCTLDIICQTTMGTEMNIQKSENAEFLNASERLLQLVTERIFKPWYHPEFIYKMTQRYKEQQQNSKIIYRFLHEIVQKKRKEYQEAIENGDEGSATISASGSFKTPQILIDQLFKLEGAHFTDSEMMSSAMSVVASGFETTALTVCFTVLLLAMNPEIQEKVYEEIKRLYPKKDLFVTYEDLKAMEYTERALKETMRLFPTVPVMGRKVNSTFDMNGLKVPKGSTVLISVISMTRDPAVWGPNSMKYNPDNFLPENLKDKHFYSFIPFGGGPRNCIGMKYAWMSMKIAMAHIVRNFHFTTDLKMEELKLELDVAMKLVNKHMVKATERED